MLFFLKVAVAIWDLLWLHTYFRIVHGIYDKNATGISIKTALNP